MEEVHIAVGASLGVPARYCFIYITPSAGWDIPPPEGIEADACPSCSSAQVVHVVAPNTETRHFCIECFDTWIGCNWTKLWRTNAHTTVSH